jgi:Caspase domain
MSSVIYERNLGDFPGLHALLIGVSEYPNLPAISSLHLADPPPPDFGMASLTATASSANQLASWLVNHKDHFHVPLASCRLLLSPSVAGRGEMADIVNASDAAIAWRKSAANNPDNISFFYFAGHGLQRPDVETGTDQALLLSGFGDDPDMIFRHGLSVNELIDGMAPGLPKNKKIARTQYFLFDACRNAPKQLKDYKVLPCSRLWDIPSETMHDRRMFVLYAAEPDHRAYSRTDGDLTHLAVALLRCLNGGVGQRDARYDLQQPRWNLTAGTLERGISHYLVAESKATRVTQSAVVTSRLDPDAVFCHLDRAPKMPLTILVEPTSACHHTCLQFHTDQDQMAMPLSPPIKPNPQTFLLDAGIYHYHQKPVPVSDGSTMELLTNERSASFTHDTTGIGLTRLIPIPSPPNSNQT